MPCCSPACHRLRHTYSRAGAPAPSRLSPLPGYRSPPPAGVRSNSSIKGSPPCGTGRSRECDIDFAPAACSNALSSAAPPRIARPVELHSGPRTGARHCHLREPSRATRPRPRRLDHRLAAHPVPATTRGRSAVARPRRFARQAPSAPSGHPRAREHPDRARVPRRSQGGPCLPARHERRARGVVDPRLQPVARKSGRFVSHVTPRRAPSSQRGILRLSAHCCLPAPPPCLSASATRGAVLNTSSPSTSTASDVSICLSVATGADLGARFLARTRSPAALPRQSLRRSFAHRPASCSAKFASSAARGEPMPITPFAARISCPAVSNAASPQRLAILTGAVRIQRGANAPLVC